MPHYAEAAATFPSQDLQTRGVFTYIRWALPTLRRAHRRRIAPWGWAQPAQTPAPDAPCRFSVAQSPNEGRFTSTRQPLPCASPPIGAESRHAAGRNPPSSPPPPPWEMSCRVSVAHSPIEERFTVQNAVLADDAPRASSPIGAESRHAAGHNPPIPANPQPHGKRPPAFLSPNLQSRGVGT